MNDHPIRLLILDVDGVLTDGRITLSADGDAGKGFCVQDGFAIKLWQKSGRQVAILSGRGSSEITRRAAELGIRQVHVGIADKDKGYTAILKEAGMTDAEVAYVGDDLPDRAPLLRCGFPIAVANAVPTVKRWAAYVTRRAGGFGAVSEVIEMLLRRQGAWSMKAFFDT